MLKTPKIGTLLPQALQINASTFQFSEPKNWRTGQAFAVAMAQQASDEQDRQRWRRLSECVPGDTLLIHSESRSGSPLEANRFLEVLPGGQKFHFSAVNANGTVYKYPLDVLPLESGNSSKPSAPGVLEGSFRVIPPPSKS